LLAPDLPARNRAGGGLPPGGGGPADPPAAGGGAMNPSARRSIAVPISAGGAQRVPIGERLRPALGGVLPRLSILHVITRLDRGGSSDCTLLQAIAAARRGHRVTIACGRTRQSSPLLVDARRLAGLEIVDVPHLRRELSPRHDVGALLFLLGLLRDRRFDIVHT